MQSTTDELLIRTGYVQGDYNKTPSLYRILRKYEQSYGLIIDKYQPHNTTSLISKSMHVTTVGAPKGGQR
jgi:hypothetical protein